MPIHKEIRELFLIGGDRWLAKRDIVADKVYQLEAALPELDRLQSIIDKLDYHMRNNLDKKNIIYDLRRWHSNIQKVLNE